MNTESRLSLYCFTNHSSRFSTKKAASAALAGHCTALVSMAATQTYCSLDLPPHDAFRERNATPSRSAQREIPVTLIGIQTPTQDAEDVTPRAHTESKRFQYSSTTTRESKLNPTSSNQHSSQTNSSNNDYGFGEYKISMTDAPTPCIANRKIVPEA